MSEGGTAFPWDDWKDAYTEFQTNEGIPVHTGLAVDDVRTLEVRNWDRLGGKGAFVNLRGMEGTCDIQIVEIPHGETLTPQCHLYDVLVYVIEGNGFTDIGSRGGNSFEWGEHSVFLLPRNTRYRHSNASGGDTARLLVVTPLPLLCSIFKDHEGVWNADEADPIDTDEYYSTAAELEYDEGENPMAYWRSNFIPNTALFEELEVFEERGGGGRSVVFPMDDSAMWSHISEFDVGQYKKAHRHVCGSNVLLLSGKGYSLLWAEGDEERKRIDWSPYSLFTPPTLWYHQQFNTSREEARYIAFHSPILGTGMYAGEETNMLSAINRGNQIEYSEEDPGIRDHFKRELEKNDIEFRMDEEIYVEGSGTVTFN